MAQDFDWLYCWVRRQLRRLEDLIDTLLPQAEPRLIENTESNAYQITTAVVDVDGVIVSGTVLWPDGVAGVYTTVTKNVPFLKVDAYTVTYAGTPAKTVTQPLVTRDGNGEITIKPALIVS